MPKGRGDKIFDAINYLLLFLLMLVFIYPLYFIIIASVSEPYAVATGNVFFIPEGFSLDAYKNVFQNEQIWTGYKNTIFYTVLGTLYNLVLMVPAAYTLSKKDLPGRKIIMTFFFITMYFGGGMIPSFLLRKSMGLINTPWVMIINSGVSCWNLIVTRQFFENSIPSDIYEAAEIDGASELKMFFRIALPLSGSILAVMTLFHAVGHWNSYYSALLYLNKQKYHPLQLVLRNILISNQNALATIDTLSEDADALAVAAQRAYIAEAMKYAVIFIASAPLLIAYPFVQKYFVKGVMTGSIKG